MHKCLLVRCASVSNNYVRVSRKYVLELFPVFSKYFLELYVRLSKNYVEVPVCRNYYLLPFVCKTGMIHWAQISIIAASWR